MSDGIQWYWPTDSRYVTQHFGENAAFYQQFGLPAHEGIDLRAPMGSNIYAMADGEVYFVGHPKDHAYGLYIRIRHYRVKNTYHTVYAHLEQAFVKNGQKVKGGERIGLGDNSGNSLGSHLHLTFKIDGVQTGAYPRGVVDPWPFLQQANSAPAPAKAKEEKPLPPASDLVVYTTVQLNLRAQATTNSPVCALLGVGEPLTVLGDANSARGKVGQNGQWIQVQTANKTAGYVAAWYVEIITQSEASPSGLIVYPNMKLNVRSGRGLHTDVLGTVEMMDELSVLGDATKEKAKIGQKNVWLEILTDSGVRGYVAAVAVRTMGQIPPEVGLSVYPTHLLSVRAQPTTKSNRLMFVKPSNELKVLGDLDQAYDDIRVAGEWLYIQTPQGTVGFVAASYVKTAEEAAYSLPKPAPFDIVYAQETLSLRAQRSEDWPEILSIPAGTKLKLFDSDLAAALATLGQDDIWLFVETAEGQQGWVEAAYLGQ